MTARAPVEVQIGALVLGGFEPRDGDGVGKALQCELERLIAEGPSWPAATRDLAFVRAEPIARDPAWAAEATGRRIARAVYEELGR